MENGVVDASDFKVFDLCEKCAGSGKVITNLRAIKESGNIADNIGS
jgi:hypothetical protein